jgi:hypothetical protein
LKYTKEEKVVNMAVTTIIKTIKSIHPDSIILVKVGKFYNVYGKDSYILSYFFNYKLKELDGIVSCGFPIESINKIMAKLENKKINYLIVDRRNNYDVEEFSNNGNLNTYNKWFEKAKKSINIKIRMDKIYNYIIENMDKDYINNILNKMEEIINETRKI